MKIIHILAVLFITIMLCNGCKKDDQRTLEPLPYFYCKINGQNYSPRGYWQCNPRTFNYYPNGFLGADSGYVIIGGQDCQTFSSVGIRIFGYIPTTDTVEFNNPVNAEWVSPFYGFENDSISDISFIDSLISGKLHFTSFSDKQNGENGIVSGTFQFVVFNEILDTTVAITEGSFQYIIDYEWY